MAAATTIATMAMINAKSIINTSSSSTPPKTLFTTSPKSPKLPAISLPKPLASTPSTLAIAGAIFSTLSSCDAALAAQQIAELAEGAGDNRGLALLLPIIPALAWVLFNILQPALNQINKMANSKGVVVGLGLGSGLAAAGLLSAPEASAAGEEIANIAAAAGGDSRGQLLLLVVAPAILWVLYNILQPALNQINKMRS